MAQTATYESRKVETAYLNNVAEHFGNRLRYVTNELLQVNQRAKILKERLQVENANNDTIKKTVKEQVYDPAKHFKEAISFSIVDTSSFNDDQLRVYEVLKPALNAYPKDTSLSKTIYIMMPKQILLSIFLGMICEERKLKLFNTFPMRTKFIPGFVQMDTMILRHHILHDTTHDVNGDNLRHWAKVLELDSRPFCSEKDLKFRGMIQTDGVSINVIKQDKASTRHGHVRRTRAKKVSDEFNYIEDLEMEQQQQFIGKCVVIDPGRRDLLYCVHEDSTPEHPMTYRYTAAQRRNELKLSKYTKLRREMFQVNEEAVKEHEALSQTSSKALILDAYKSYLSSKANCKNMREVYRDRLYRKLRFSAYSWATGLHPTIAIMNQSKESGKEECCKNMALKYY
ncbi:hypothetical protein Unana1_02109 [Umbelopsis nana]